MKINNQSILIAILIIIVGYLLFKPSEDIRVINVRPQLVNKGIASKEKTIERFTVAVDNGKKYNAEIYKSLEDMALKLSQFKRDRDTFNIVPIQDTMISILYRQNVIQDGIIAGQDTIINAQRFIINSKDTLYAIQGDKLKQTKRRLLFSMIANGVLTGVAILK